MALLGIIPQSIVADVAEADSIKTGEKREGMFFAARTFAMKFGQSIAMLVFTSIAMMGLSSDTNDIATNPYNMMWVAIVAVIFCVLGAIILFFYREKKVMKMIAKEGDEAFMEAIKNEKEFDDEVEVETENFESAKEVENKEEVKEDK